VQQEINNLLHTAVPMRNPTNRFVLTSPHPFPTLHAVDSHPRQSWSLSGFFNFLNPLRGKKSSEEPEEEFSDEGASYDEKRTVDGSEFGAPRPPEILSQRGHAVRHIPTFISSA